MKKNILHIAEIVLAAMLVFSTAAMAQDRKGGKDDAWKDRIASMKIAFLTSEMDLTPEEAQNFWPIYNKAQAEMDEAMGKVMKAFGDMDRAIRDGKSDKEISGLLHVYTSALAASKGIEEKYAKAYEKVISSTKVAKLFVGEEKFRMQQIRKLGAPDGKKDARDGREQKEPASNKPECAAEL
jgi:L-asparaginase II